MTIEKAHHDIDYFANVNIGDVFEMADIMYIVTHKDYNYTYFTRVGFIDNEPYVFPVDFPMSIKLFNQ